MSQVRSSPQLVDDADFIGSMRACELKKLEPASLNPYQLSDAFRRAELLGLCELAFDMLLELEQRPDTHDFDKGHFIDLLKSAMEAGNIEPAKKIRAHVPPEIMAEPKLTQLRFDLLENRQYLQELESLLRQEMTGTTDMPDSPLLDLSYGFEKSFPALSIVLARAYISANPDRMPDIQTLLKTVRRARAAIGIEAWEDPIEDYVEWSFARDLEEFREADRSEKLGKLIKDAEAAGRKILIPQYSTDFCRACEAVPPPVAAKARKSVTEFAAADETARRHTRPIKRIAQCYRIRIGKNYRVLLPFNVLFLVAVFGVWNRSGNAIFAAGTCALGSFLINVFASGISVFACCWAVASFLVALVVFLGLSYIQRSFWMIPGAVLGSFILIVFF